jgi:hypothetical protein
MKQALDIGETLKLGWDGFSKNAVAFIVGLLLVGLVGTLSLGICLGPMVLGYNMMYLRAARGEKVEVFDVFAGFSRFLPSFLLMLIIGIGVTVGLVLLVVPGVVLAYLFFWAFWIMADGEDDFMVCLKKSWTFQQEHLGPSIVFALVATIISAAGGTIPFGALIAAPVANSMIANGYVRAFSAQAGVPGDLDG